MSLCLRPVVESWGESMTFSCRETHISELIVAIAEQAEDVATAQTYEYGDDLTVAYICEGEAFLNHMEGTGSIRIIERLEEDGILSVDDEENTRERQDLTEICGLAAEWRKSLDPKDGSLRIYCD